MSDQEILKKAIRKALDKGWKPRSYKLEDGQELFDETISSFDIYRYGMKKVTFFNEDAVRFFIPVWEIIFSHDFAKALWGDDKMHSNHPTWHWNLQRMVIADEPIRYLGENL